MNEEGITIEEIRNRVLGRVKSLSTEALEILHFAIEVELRERADENTKRQG